MRTDAPRNRAGSAPVNVDAGAPSATVPLRPDDLSDHALSAGSGGDRRGVVCTGKGEHCSIAMRGMFTVLGVREVPAHAGDRAGYPEAGMIGTITVVVR
jgi:hypothetical protein